MTNFSASTWITLEGGYAEVVPSEYALQTVTLNDTPSGGTIAWNTAENASALAVASGTTIVQPMTAASPGVPTAIGVVATPSPGWTFVNWTVNDSAAAYVVTGTVFSQVEFNSTGVVPLTITANFAVGGSVAGTLTVSPAGSGSVTLGLHPNHLTGGNGTVPNASFYVEEFPNSGFVVTGLSVTNGSALLVAGTTPVTRPWAPWVWIVTPNASAISLNATFAPLAYPVTFVANSPSGTPVGTLNGTPLTEDETVWLANGTYSLSVVLGSGVTFSSWTTSWSRLNLSNSSLPTTRLNVTGSGSVYALGQVGAPSPIVSASISPGEVDLLPGGSAGFNASVRCLGNTSCPSGATFAWSLTNATAGSLNATTGAAVEFLAGSVYATTDLLVNATLNGTSVTATAGPVAVVPALTGVVVVSLVPLTIYAGQSVGLTANISCTDALPCPSGATYDWNGGNASLGTVLSATGRTTTYESTPGVNGTAVVTVTATLNGANATAFADVAVVLPLLTGVVVAPATLATSAGASTNFSATPSCSAGAPCPAGTTFAWTLSPSALGTLSSASGAATVFTAGTSNVSGWLNASGTLNGVVVSASSVPVSVAAGPVVLVRVSIAPATATLGVGQSESFAANLSCSPSPCPSGIVVSWSLSAPVGTLSASTGAGVVFNATAAGNATLSANATVGGASSSGSAALTVTGVPGSGTTSSTPFYESPLLWLAVVVVLVVIFAAAILMRRDPTPPGPGSPGGTAPP
jgi:hypothetical protein